MDQPVKTEHLLLGKNGQELRIKSSYKSTAISLDPGYK